jgi:UDP-N-acetylglucosamine--N-acetylmuramyl-(pentapeptide) pyrophosphoryl-undecaprenol N-acetylglucosamine transferase
MALVFFVGGGSVGHIAPSVAVWETLQETAPGSEALFICADRDDDCAFLSAHGLPCSPLRAPRLSLGFPFRFGRAVAEAGRLLDTRRPAAIFSKGGYVSLPVCFAARRRRVPIVLHESDAVEGWANRLIGFWADRVCLGFPDEGGRRSKAVVTGNPVRFGIDKGSRERGLSLTGFSGKRPVLLVIGGSQGAQAINQVVAASLGELTAACDVIHLTGREKGNPTQREGYWQAPFVTEELPHLYAAADMALSRAGAGAIGELAANGMATIFCPLRGVAHDHQQRNADAVLAAGGCIVIQQEDLARRLSATISTLAASSEQREILARNLRPFHHPDAARRIAGIIAETLAS